MGRVKGTAAAGFYFGLLRVARRERGLVDYFNSREYDWSVR